MLSSQRLHNVDSSKMPSSTSSGSVQNDPHRQFHEASFANLQNAGDGPSRADDPDFDIFDWYPKYQSCQRYFLDHSQHSVPVQALAAFINILLPFQRPPQPVHSATGSGNQGPSRGSSRGMHSPIPVPTTLPPVSLLPFVRRLVVTGMDFPGVLHGFFGDDWRSGVGAMHEQERRNYLFAAKSGGWASVKRDYDMLPLETVPFLRPLQGVSNAEIGAAEKTWSEWLAMEDWMVGPRAPEQHSSGRSRES